MPSAILSTSHGLAQQVLTKLPEVLLLFLFLGEEAGTDGMRSQPVVAEPGASPRRVTREPMLELLCDTASTALCSGAQQREWLLCAAQLA